MQHPDDCQTDDWVFCQTGQKRDKDEYIKQYGETDNSNSRRGADEGDASKKARRIALYSYIKRQISFDFL